MARRYTGGKQMDISNQASVSQWKIESLQYEEEERLQKKAIRKYPLNVERRMHENRKVPLNNKVNKSQYRNFKVE